MNTNFRAELAAWRDFRGPPEAFERAFLEQLVQLCEAEAGVWMQRESSSGWQRRNDVPTALSAPWNELEQLASEAAASGAAVKRYPAGAQFVHMAGARLAVASGEAVAVLRLPQGSDEAAIESARRMRLLAEAPLAYELQRQAREAETRAERFARVLDLLLLLNAQSRFLAASMVVCNELAARFACDRVSLGWLDGDRVRLQAISHGEKFERGREVVQALEAAMEEAVEQDAELLWPEGDSGRTVMRSHAAFAELERSKSVATFPLRIGSDPTGAVTLETTGRLPAEVLDELRLIGDQVARRLGDLRTTDRWFGARWLAAARAAAARWLGVEHTGAKLAALAAAVVLLALPIVHLEYRIHAPFKLKSDTLAELPAPFDGYIEQVHFRLGDHVQAGQSLLTLDTRELHLEEVTAQSVVQRHEAEAQKAEAEGNVAEMRIARAAADENRAHLAIVTRHLAQAEVTAPFEGYVVSGDLQEKTGAPVRQGDILLRVAKIDALYPEIRIPETSVAQTAEGAAVSVVFLSRPREVFPAQLATLEPISEANEQGNAFIGRGRWTGPPMEWWRPGMSGEARVTAGRRSLLWILTHRTIDALRLRLWW